MADGNSPELTVVSSQEATPEAARRERSTIEFPYYDLADAEEIATTVHQLGTTCTVEQLAGALRVVPDGGGFRTRLSAARTFGLLSLERGTVTLTDLGARICDPQQAKAARVDAFQTVPLYGKVFDNFRGKTLPPPTGLESAMVNLGVAPKQKERARQAFQRSAKHAGFFDVAPDRLVPPALGRPITLADERKEVERSTDTQKYDQLIDGLLQLLPSKGKDWPLEARKKWLQALATNLDVLYQSSDPKAIKITIE
ncbi:MAG TPA: hypothetical protein VFA67_05620 [Candidatus Sulfotelmatobacter sp.]|nr:hypothetical protein [Candidatus Sulfotelmatobacter sp.]